MTRVLVTGATGLVGRETVNALAARGAEVVALSRSGTAVSNATETHAVDLMDADATRRVVRAIRAEALVHLAWYGGPGRMTSGENVDWAAATLGLVRTFATEGGLHVTAAGSCAEYDWRDPGPFSETSPLHPQSLYGAAKARTGQLLTEAARSLGLSLAWGRIFFVYGPGEPSGRLLGDLIAGLRAGREVPCTDGLQRRDFLSTRDVADALVQLTLERVTGPVNVASGQATTVRDVIETAARLLGRPELVRLGARPRPPNDPPEIVANTTRLGELGFCPRLSLEAGLADAIARTP